MRIENALRHFSDSIAPPDVLMEPEALLEVAFLILRLHTMPEGASAFLYLVVDRVRPLQLAGCAECAIEVRAQD